LTEVTLQQTFEKEFLTFTVDGGKAKIGHLIFTRKTLYGKTFLIVTVSSRINVGEISTEPSIL
jgi:hypothetical protein